MTGSTMLVMYEESASDAKNTYAGDSSSGWAGRFGRVRAQDGDLADFIMRIDVNFRAGVPELLVHE
jgi:hypothetical protein